MMHDAALDLPAPPSRLWEMVMMEEAVTTAPVVVGPFVFVFVLESTCNNTK